MKVVVVGGYGVFGARLVTLLVRDGHEVVVAGRNLQAATEFATQVGATPIVFDRAGDLAGLWALAPDAVVDAAGPFHGYGDDPYRLAKACIAHGVHYLDLADDPVFCANIAELDEAAGAAGVFALSGASSVPAISSAAVAAMVPPGSTIETISTAILPGNRAPRGRSVVASILHQCGTSFEMTQDGAPVQVRSWSQSRMFDLGQGIRRRGWTIAVPDQTLFPARFGTKTVTFHAGLELPVMNYALASFSRLRGLLGFGVPQFLISSVMWIADRLAPFGTGVGGMIVTVTHKTGDKMHTSVWRLIARAGDGPYIPAITARAILRQPDHIKRGAGPALAVVPLADIEAAMEDIAVTTDLLVQDEVPLFPAFLGADFDKLSPAVRAGHAVDGALRLAGRARVTRGRALWSRLLAAVFRFPPANDDVPVTVQMTAKDGGEMWERRFDGRPFWSFLKIRDGVMTERFGPLTFQLGLHVAQGDLFYPVDAGRLGPIPLPKMLLPQSTAREFEKDGKFHFDVELSAPITGALMVHYQGWLAPVTP